MRLLALLLICSVGFAEDLTMNVVLPPDAKQAIASYDAAVAKAKADVIAKLQKAQETATKRGDLDGAMAIKARIADLDPSTKGSSAPTPGHRLFMGDLPLLKQEALSQVIVAKDEKSASKTVVVNGAKCVQYIYAVAPSVIECRIPGGAKRFTAKGMTLGSRSITFVVSVDGKEMAKGDGGLDVDITIPAGAQKLTLLCDNQGDSNADHSLWALPFFEGP